MNDRKYCPCSFGSPCHPKCSCANPNMSFGCMRCCSYGSQDQQNNSASLIVEREKLHKELADLVHELFTGKFSIGMAFTKIEALKKIISKLYPEKE